MKNIEKEIARVVVKSFSYLFYPLKIKENKITYISYKNNSMPLDMKLISNEISKENIISVKLFMKVENTITDKIKYFFQLFKQIYHINTSKVVVLDANNFVVSNIKKKEHTKIVQIWHATGAIKKFGNDYKRSYDIKNYDYIITSSSKSIKRMASAFGVEDKIVKPLGVAMTDILFDKVKMRSYKEEMIKKYPIIDGKKVILYAPTFRGEGIFDNRAVTIDANKILKEIGEDYVFVYKLHPIIAKSEVEKDNPKIINMSFEDLYKTFSIADILISDYSAIIYDFSILEKQMILFAPDYKQYERDRGFYDNYKETMPGEVVETEKELIEIIKRKNCRNDKVINLKNEFFDYKDGKSAKRIANLIESLL